jgi:hypothetical protein
MLGYIRNTHFGHFLELRNRARPTLLAHIPGPIRPHPDDTYRDVPLGISVLHCIQPSSDGGGASELMDSFAVAAQLKSEDPDAYSLPVPGSIRHERLAEGEFYARLAAFEESHREQH